MQKAKRERNAEIILKHNEGASYADLAKEYNLSRQRIEQICVAPKLRQMKLEKAINMCTNGALLKALIYRNGMTAKEVAGLIGIGVVAFSNKINGKSEFKCGEMKALKELLNMTDYEFAYIFLR